MCSLLAIRSLSGAQNNFLTTCNTTSVMWCSRKYQAPLPSRWKILVFESSYPFRILGVCMNIFWNCIIRVFSNNFPGNSTCLSGKCQTESPSVTVKTTSPGLSDTTFSKCCESPFIGNASLVHDRLPKAFCWLMANTLSVTPGWSKILGN